MSDDEYDLVVYEITLNGKKYLADEDKQLYDVVTHEWVGFYGDIYNPPRK